MTQIYLLPLDVAWYQDEISPFLKEEGQCLIWSRSLDSKKYGQVWYKSVVLLRVHRVVWMMENGSVPIGRELGHFCEKKHCVRHVRPITHQQNIGEAAYLMQQNSFNGNKIVCSRGHSYSGTNLIYDKRGHRVCIACRRLGNLNEYNKRHGIPERY